MKKRIMIKSLSKWFGIFLLVGLTACGGSSDTTSTDSGEFQVASGKIIGFGSVVVNGIEFSRKPSLVADDRVILPFENITSASEATLRLGMNVNIRGTVNSATGKGEYESIEFQPELRGPLDADSINISTNTLTVMGRKVQVAANTSFDGGINDLADISQAVTIPELEISGNLDDNTGILTATRIARKASDFALTDKIVQIKGQITTVDVPSSSFTMSTGTGTFSVNFTLDDLGSNTIVTDIAVGSFFEVKGILNGTAIAASRVEMKNAVDAEANDRVNLKGTANGGIVDNTFTINGPNGTIIINTAAASFQKDGAAATSAIVTAGITLEIEGVLQADGSVAATEVHLEVEKNVKLEGNAAAGAFSAGTLTLNSVPVTIGASTRLLDQSGETLDLTTIAEGDHLQIVGLFDRVTNQVKASQVKRTSPRDVTIVQGPVTAVASPKLTLFGMIIVDTTVVNPATGFGDDRSMPKVPFASPAAFFAALTSDGFTVVKAKGTMVGTTMNASDVDLEQTQ